MEKTCKSCGRTFDISQFPPHHLSKDGHSYICRDCKHEIYVRAQLPNTKKAVVDGSNPLAQYTPRELMSELRRRGYKGTLTYIQEINLEKIY